MALHGTKLCIDCGGNNANYPVVGSIYRSTPDKPAENFSAIFKRSERQLEHPQHCWRC